MTLEREGLYDVSVHKILLESELKAETIFECLLTIPGTSFSAKADNVYVKGQKGITHSLIRGVLIQSCSAGARNLTKYVFFHVQFGGLVQNPQNYCAISVKF